MITIFLHIGTHKTGTTSLQQFFHQNQNLFKDLGYLYPKSGRIEGYPLTLAHHGLAWELLAQNQTAWNGEWLEADWNDRQEIVLKSTGKRLTLTAEWGKLDQELRSAQQNNIILSSEDFAHCRLWEIESIKEKLRSHTVKIIVTLRNPQDFAWSLYQEAVKKGSIKSFEQFFQEVKDNLNYWNYDHLLEPWIKVFGKDNLLIIDYENTKQDQQLMFTVLKTINLDLTPDLMKQFKFPASRTNPSSSPQSIRMIVTLNRFFIGVLGWNLKLCRRLYIQPLNKRGIQRLMRPMRRE